MKMTQAELRRYFNGIKSRELRSLERKLNMLRNQDACAMLRVLMYKHKNSKKFNKLLNEWRP